MTSVGIVLAVLYRIPYGYYVLLVVTLVLGWTPLLQTRFHRFLRSLTDPYLNLFSGKLVYRAVDFTPLLGLALFQLVLFVVGRSLS